MDFIIKNSIALALVFIIASFSLVNSSPVSKTDDNSHDELLKAKVKKLYEKLNELDDSFLTRTNQNETVLLTRIKRKYDAPRGHGNGGGSLYRHSSGGGGSNNYYNHYGSGYNHGLGSYDYDDFYGSDLADYAYDYYDWICSDSRCTLCDVLTSECCDPETDEHCFLPDSCLNNPCLSGGTCISTKTVDDRDDFICVCLPGLTGKYCQLKNDYYKNDQYKNDNYANDQGPALYRDYYYDENDDDPYRAPARPGLSSSYSSYHENDYRSPSLSHQYNHRPVYQQPIRQSNSYGSYDSSRSYGGPSLAASPSSSSSSSSGYSASVPQYNIQSSQPLTQPSSGYGTVPPTSMGSSSYDSNSLSSSYSTSASTDGSATASLSSMPHYIQQTFRTQPLSLKFLNGGGNDMDSTSSNNDNDNENSTGNDVKPMVGKRCAVGQRFSFDKQKCVDLASS